MVFESEILSQILIALGRDPRCFIFRNNTGALPDRHGRLIRYGLVGSADILGCLRPSGRFLAIEVKTKTGIQSTEQQAFQRTLIAAGGIYLLARSVQDALDGVTLYSSGIP